MNEFLMMLLATFIGGVLVVEFVATASILSDFIIKAARYLIHSDLKQDYEDRWQARLKKIPGNIGKVLYSVGCLLFVWSAFIYAIVMEVLSGFKLLGHAVREAFRVHAKIRAAGYAITSIKIARGLNQLGNNLSQISE